MTAPSPSAQKICTLCGENVAAKPRVKDRQGRYYCEPCYQRALSKTAATSPPAAAAPPPAAPDDDTGGGLFEELSRMEQSASPDSTSAHACPGCGGPLAAESVVCVSCGFDRRSGRRSTVAVAQPVARAASVPTAASTAGVDFSRPWVPALAATIALFALFAVAKATDNPLLYFMVQKLFSAGIGIWALVAAFQTGIGTGFMTLCIPLYALYFIYAVNDNPHLKYMFAVSVLSLGLLLAFPDPIGLTGLQK